MSLSTLRQYATFYLDESYFGIDVLRVQELLPAQQMTPVPRAPADIAGLVNLRGQIIPAVDLRVRLKLPGQTPAACMNVIVRTPEGLVSLLVDRVGDVLEIPADSFETTPQTAAAQASACTAGVHKLADQLLIVLDLERVCRGEREATA